ncbi:glycine zipper 2TM domain-containing protein [Methylobacillus pratensis]|uniref:glycine zipper 2TM domain-containing protein n=1 Tax=Methylobacillus TaxID=404 RepID=UPI0028541728|nr:glycine zipper 2TM domain-containing protein [Methylobacillus flagellatus]MDR5170513.1 glycine zipper 2TM domain-containing protein [Methylobacillus flagellatus]
MRITSLLAAAIILLTLGGCMSSNSGDVYSRDEARKTQTVRLGVVESVRNVRLEGTKTPIGGGAGAVVGGIAGSSVGGGRGQAIATVLGALVGGLAGAAAEEGVTRKDGLEITVKLESGNLIAVVQEADVQFNPGDKVRLVESGGVTRVTH